MRVSVHSTVLCSHFVLRSRAQWQWQNDKCEWEAFDLIANDFLNDFYGKGWLVVVSSLVLTQQTTGKNKISLKIGGRPYDVDMANLFQTNRTTKRQRYIRRIGA